MNRISNSFCHVAVACLVGIYCPLLACRDTISPGSADAEKLLLLGDVAEIYAAEPQETQRLAAVELMPASAAGKPAIRIRDIQELLAIRGMNWPIAILRRGPGVGHDRRATESSCESDCTPPGEVADPTGPASGRGGHCPLPARSARTRRLASARRTEQSQIQLPMPPPR